MRLASLASAIALVTSATTAAYAQSLGEVARKEEERRKTAKASGKVYTDADLKRFAVLAIPTEPATPPTAQPGQPPAGTPPATGEAAAPPGATAGETGQPGQPAAEGAPPAEEARDQAWWRKQFSETRTKLDMTRANLQALTTQYELLAWAIIEDPQEQARRDRERERVKSEIDKLTAEASALSRALATLDAEARRANVPPGWIR